MLQTFITFQGKANEAINFYEEVFQVTNKEIMRWGDSGSSNAESEKMKDKVLHAKMSICGTEVMFSDTNPDFHEPEVFAPSCFISLAVTFESEEKLRNAYDKLAKKGVVLMELGPQFFANMYAWVQDRFGVTWQLTYNS